MLMSEKELNDWQRMFEDAECLTRGGPSALYWMKLRDYLERESALAYLREGKDEYLFQAIQLCELGLGRWDWERVEANLNALRRGEKLTLLPDWEGAWAKILQIALRTDWDAQDKIRARFFINVRTRG